ncbi:LytR/AlgR family response regulator transcription factor [Piscinibacter terrae]|uniref:DNA-binding response regulator n=1 Tax=Piscinibacter terrae TaxID=2496871 RepID=A0A3N7JXT5_9BURK|nr:LytTR family DNA-binding domain-containing protein [Albitalea terrae]RQP25649.1 DNA-binding response regulator [Albitalea terrae]
MTTALIADDEPHLAAYLKDQLLKLWPELEIIGIARNGIEAAQEIARLAPDLAFLDIKMPGLTGLEVAQGIEGRTQVVFVTAYDDYAVQAFEHEAVDYVLKPVKSDRLARTIERVRRALAQQEPETAQLAAVLRKLMPAGGAAPEPARLRYVRASQGELMHQVPVGEVLFFRSDEKYTSVQTAGGEHLIRTPISELAAQLDPQQFWQIHRSTIINLDHVTGTRRDELSRLYVRIRGWTGELPVSRAYVHLFKSM